VQAAEEGDQIVGAGRVEEEGALAGGAAVVEGDGDGAGAAIERGVAKADLVAAVAVVVGDEDAGEGVGHLPGAVLQDMNERGEFGLHKSPRRGGQVESGGEVEG